MSDDKPIFPTVFVRGEKTTTTAYDNQLAKDHADAEARRDEEAKRYRAARDPRLPKAGVVAKQRTLQLGGKNTHPMIVLRIKRRDEGQMTSPDFITCELSMQGDPLPGTDGKVHFAKGSQKLAGDPELVLIVACPKCAFRQRKGDTYQLAIKSSQKKMIFEPGKAPAWNKGGLVWFSPVSERNALGNVVRETLQLAGTIHVEEWCQCTNFGCGFTFKIDDSMLIPKW